MGELVVGTFLTLDGVMQAPGGPDEDRSDGFEHGGWLAPLSDDDLGRTVMAWMERSKALLLGRRTYEIFASYWPRFGDENPIAASLNHLPKHVATRTLGRLEWANSTVLSGEVPEAVAALKERTDGEIHVHGSGNLVQTLMPHDLIDEYRLRIAPVVLGSGRRLFADGAVPAGLELVESATSSTGVIMSTYRRAGEVRYGSFAGED